ncbi:MAG: peptidyl-prolyl cis-trans isomerase [Balneola sp.]
MKTLLYLILSGSLFIGCKANQNSDNIILAEVNGSVLTMEEAKAGIPSSEFQSDSVLAYNNFIEKWIEKQLILQESERLKIPDSPEIKKRIERARQDMIAISFQEAVLNNLNSEIIVTDEEVQDYYQQNKDQFLLDERYIRFRHLIASSLADAENAKRDLMQGQTWERVAQNYSLQSEMVIKNASRFWPESNALKEFDTLNRYLRLIGVTEISIIENINGKYHFVQLLEEKAVGEHPDLEWLLIQIKEWLILEKKRIAYNTYVKNLYLAAEANNEIRTYNVLPNNINKEITSDSLNSN